MSIIAVIVGVLIVTLTLADLVNTLVTTTTITWRWWPTVITYNFFWRRMRNAARRWMSESRRERLYAFFAPTSVILLLVMWVVLQIVGFGLIWWGTGAVDGLESFGDAIYYSGVVFFTLGFGEIVPVEIVPRIGALIEAFGGVLTTALVIGYLPALYSAFSAREQQLLTLDDGSEGRITPTNLVFARCPDADPRTIDSFFEDWEQWTAQVMETHTTFRMLVLFRSQHPGQSWITALGVVTDAALHLQLVNGEHGRASYWMFRRAAHLFHTVTQGMDVSEHRAQLDEVYDSVDESNAGFEAMYSAMEAHGFDMLPRDVAQARVQEFRRAYDAHMELLIENLDAPRGFWGHVIGHQLDLGPHALMPQDEPAPG